MILHKARIRAIKDLDKHNRYSVEVLDQKTPEELSIIYYSLQEGIAIEKARARATDTWGTLSAVPHERFLDGEY